MDDKILDAVTQYYLRSGDFNGTPLRTLPEKLGIRLEQIASAVSPLVADGRLTLNFGDRHPNPHIKAFPSESIEVQVEKLSSKTDLNNVCAYPSQGHLATVVEESEYDGRPFTLRLALGEPQLSFITFDLSILEAYRNDPRYSYDCDDIWGHISIHDATELPERDQIFLQHFGFAYDSELNRGVAVFLCYLSDLSPEHQQVWNTKILSGEFILHPDYFDTAILGKWAEGISIFQAFGEELHLINEMCGLMGKPPLFKNEFRDSSRPKEFAFLLRPTQKEFNDFVLVLDKMLSENLNPKYFHGDIPTEWERVRKDGKVFVEQKGTIQLLEEHLNTSWHVEDEQPLSELLDSFRTVRKLRQAPAHKLDNNKFDPIIFKRQRCLIIEAYSAVRTIRMLFSNHPRAKQLEIPDQLFKGDRIRTY